VTGLPAFELELTDELLFILELGVALALALLAGAAAVRLKQPPIVGYLIAGVVIGPFTPGFVSSTDRISELAEVGVILLLFALGVEFSISGLMRVRRIVVPGALAEILLVTLVGATIATLLGFDVRAAIVIGAAVSISSTLVVLKILLDRGETDSLHGRIAIGWMIVQDIAAILLMAILPPLSGGDLLAPLGLAILKAALFLALAYVVGTRFLPWLFRSVSRLGSPELFLLAVFATALITAFLSSAVFGLSLALGAFIAGLIVSESELSHQAAGEVTPFRDLFAVLVFVSVGMLLDPAALLADLPALALLLVAAVGAKALASGVAGRLLGMPVRSAILLGATVAQIGEFSFLIAEEALHLEILDPRAYNLILATAVLSIVASPLLVQAANRLVLRLEHARSASPEAPVAGALPATRGELATEDGRVSVVVLGAGRVGRVVIRAVRARGFRCIAVDRDQRRLEEAAAAGAATLFGDAANPAILARCGLDRARLLVVAVGDPLTARLAAERALAINPRLAIAARARGSNEIRPLMAAGVRRVADPELEAALELARAALHGMGVSGPEQTAVLGGLRRRAYGEGSGPTPAVPAPAAPEVEAARAAPEPVRADDPA
jgi:CPA2 family monovalent cation:H+ antiporter-2